MEVIGRERERRQVEAILVGRGVRAVMLHGEAGIGKTVLWTEVLEMAGARGFRVVSTRPTEAEAKLPFVGLSDLLGDLVDTAADGIPRPQLLALEAALMRADVEGEPIQPLALALGALEVIRAASAARPLAIGIDDVGWLDESSAGVLRFALRRLESAPVVVVATMRADGVAPTSALLEDLDPGQVTRVEVGPLGASEIEMLLVKDGGLALPPAAHRRVHRASEGNPLHALEIARALAVDGAHPDGSTTAPDSLTSLVRRRLDELTPEARAVVVHAAALARPTSLVLERALGQSGMAGGLAEARSADVLGPGDDPIRFTHPLLATEAYGALADADRRAVHARLAQVIEDTEERARHLALAADGPDPRVVAELEAAATLARERGARDAAADLSELAAGLAGAGAERMHLLAVAGRDRLMAGDIGRARTLLEVALEDPAARHGVPRAELLFGLAGVRQLMDDQVAAEELAGQALRHAGSDTALRVRIRLLLAGVAFVTERSWAQGARHAAEAHRLGIRSGDRALEAATVGPDASWRYATGRRVARDLEQRAGAAEPWMRQVRAMDLPAYDLATIELAEGSTSKAYERFRALAARAENDGDYSSLPFLLAVVAMGDFLDGKGDEARARIDRALHLARTTDQRTAQAHVLVYAARLEARLGNAEGAARALAAAVEPLAATGWRVGEWLLKTDLAVLELGRSAPEAALAHVGDAADRRRHDVSGRWRLGLGVAVEALVALGRLDDAAAALEADGRRRTSGRLRADRLRARARLLGALGDAGGADAAIEAALGAHRGMDDRWETARTQLVAGEIHRRARRRALARAAFRDALEGFLFLGARSWADMARDQLARAEAGPAEGALTPTQRSVASLAAGGMRNRQIAGRLGMSPHTVEAHLSVVYRTLGIRRRGELSAALAQRSEMRDSADPDRDSGSS